MLWGCDENIEYRRGNSVASGRGIAGDDAGLDKALSISSNSISSELSLLNYCVERSSSSVASVKRTRPISPNTLAKSFPNEMILFLPIDGVMGELYFIKEIFAQKNLAKLIT